MNCLHIARTMLWNQFLSLLARKFTYILLWSCRQWLLERKNRNAYREKLPLSVLLNACFYYCVTEHWTKYLFPETRVAKSRQTFRYILYRDAIFVSPCTANYLYWFYKFEHNRSIKQWITWLDPLWFLQTWIYIAY